MLIINGQILERDSDKLSRLFGTSHQIGDWEVEKLLEQNPEIILIGTGQSGMLNVDQNFYEKVKDKDVEIITDITPKAIKIYNEKIKEGRRVNALIHTTC